MILNHAGSRGYKKGPIHARLAELERVHDEIVRAGEHSTEGAGGGGIQWAHNMLSISGVEQSETESLPEALARAVHISMKELRGRLQEGASGGPF